ncbi:MAG: 50S ribosomal protein L20 [candidate division TM6 bacterium GW2011_GWE2_42_60]|nr:MAG: 50S ribosomal protein L20 [candidate division TM6 bacterium GW2011_GWE2_42_60]HBY06155.1 50S ribosomal protein L20 [Candidatus Dependentiae bacterium]
MTRVKRGVVTKKRHKRLLNKTEGFWGQRKNVFRRAKETLLRAMAFAFVGRKLKKRDMRALFINRISAAAEKCGTTYSVLIHQFKQANIQLNRKMLSQIAILDFPAFEHLVRVSKK